MTPIRFTASIVLLGFLFILLALGNSAADTHSDEISEKKLRTTTRGINPGSIDQDVWDGVPTAAAAPAVWNGKLGGRKMLVGNVLSKEMMMVMKQEGQMNNGEEASSSAKISGAKHSVGKCEHHEGNKGMIECYKLSTEHRSLLPVKVVGFITFSADYHVPKPHPPKNNR